MSGPRITTVCFVGAGTMGCYNSLVAAISGYRAVVFDVNAESLARVADAHAGFAEFLVGHGYCERAAVGPALQRIRIEPDLAAAVADADLVSESIFERLEVKRSVHEQLDALCPPRTILTTNTSALRVSDIESAVERGERFAALHSHLGAPLVDIVGGPRTSADTIDVLRRYTESIGGVPLVLKKEHPGYVLNAMLGPLLRTAMLLAGTDEPAFEDVDRAWMHFRRAPMGPFGMIDLFGINLIHDSWQYREVEGAEAGVREHILTLLQPYLSRNHLGMKSGAGFYRYPDPAYQGDGFLDRAAALAPLHDILAAVLVANGVYLAAIGVADPGQIDMAWKTGTYLDAGPFEILAELGQDGFLLSLRHQVAAGYVSPAAAAAIDDYLRDAGERPR